jgi:hypothetical protein
MPLNAPSSLGWNTRRVGTWLCEANSGEPSTRGQLIWFQATIQAASHYLLPAWPLSTDTIHHPAAALWYRHRGNSSMVTSSALAFLPVSCLSMTWFWMDWEWSNQPYGAEHPSRGHMRVPSIYETRKFITAFTRVLNLSVSWGSQIQSKPPAILSLQESS